MEDNREAIEQNTEESIETKAEETKPAADSVMDDDIQYTFVVPKGEIYREPAEPAQAETEPETEKTLVADRRHFTEEVNDALEDAAEADAAGRTIFLESPIFDATGLPDDDDITYTFVVPKGEIYKEPDPEEERAAREAEKARRAVAKAAREIPPGSTEILSAETKVMERTPGEGTAEKKTRYGLPANHPEMGELAKKQAERRRYKQRKKNRFMTRFYILITAVILLIWWLIISNSGLFTIDAIEVKGNSHYTAEEIINIGHATSGHNIVYQANIKETKEFLEQNPYIKHAEVRRRLPSTLVIKVTEREERLAFKYDDDYLVMDEDGILLRKTRNKPMTTIVQGIVVSKIKLGEKIGTENNTRMDMALDLIKEMIKADLYYVKLDVENVKTIKAYIYDTLIVKTDYDTLMTNMENGKLHLVVEQLFKDGIERGTITFNEDGSVSFMPIF